MSKVADSNRKCKPDADQKDSVASRFLRMLLQTDLTLFHDADDRAYAFVEMDGVWQTQPLKGRRFITWAKARFYATENVVPSAHAVADALGILEAEALRKGRERDVPTRVAENPKGLHIALADEDWQAVTVPPGQPWIITPKPDVRFRRPRAMRPLPTPVKSPETPLEKLRDYVNVEDAEWRLFLAWLLFALTPSGPFPVLILRGGQGSGKSWQARVLKDLIDPNTAPLRGPPRDSRDLAIAANNGWLLVYDNLSSLPDWLSDDICKLATGAGFATRALYTDGDEVIFASKRPVALTSIEDVATRGDLLERSIVINVPTIPPGRRKDEKQLQADFERDRPALFGAILDALAETLGKLTTVSTPTSMRMADFARFGVAAEQALGWKTGSFLNAYQTNRQTARDIALSDSLLAGALFTLLKHNPEGWEGTATQLLERLNADATETVRKSRGWPQSPRALSGQLRRLAPDLEAAGILFESGKDNSHNRNRTIKLSPVRTEKAAGPPSGASTPSDAPDAPDAPDGGPPFDSHDLFPPQPSAH